VVVFRDGIGDGENETPNTSVHSVFERSLATLVNTPKALGPLDALCVGYPPVDRIEPTQTPRDEPRSR